MALPFRAARPLAALYSQPASALASSWTPAAATALARPSLPLITTRRYHDADDAPSPPAPLGRKSSVARPLAPRRTSPGVRPLGSPATTLGFLFESDFPDYPEPGVSDIFTTSVERSLRRKHGPNWRHEIDFKKMAPALQSKMQRLSTRRNYFVDDFKRKHPSDWLAKGRLREVTYARRRGRDFGLSFNQMSWNGHRLALDVCETLIETARFRQLVTYRLGLRGDFRPTARELWPTFSLAAGTAMIDGQDTLDRGQDLIRQTHLILKAISGASWWKGTDPDLEMFQRRHIARKAMAIRHFHESGLMLGAQ